MSAIVPAPRSIPTTYRGTRFRSRLEARWAATFDALAWYWEYEPYGVDFGDGYRYLCDFHLPAQRCWVEVKGPINDRIDKTNRLRKHVPRRDLVIIARPSGPDGAANFHSPTSWVGVTVQLCTACGQRCFYDYQHDRNTGGNGWACRTCRTEDALQRTDSYLPALEREYILHDPKQGRTVLDAFWPTTSGLLPLEQIGGAR